ncbi:major facilitator superfamily domain-containing protein [Exophiala viscosa]|uniref:Major facilitator superfamily domain-containing protein n=1 Tax=Exophiala viscosa TaxID=2486360 RepID=A0AAN6IEK8_9EURO|nr:major facilitator superfamily domain-containing protein [Exophiala viscosa]
MNPDKNISQHLESSHSAGYDGKVDAPSKSEANPVMLPYHGSDTVDGLSPEHREYLLRVHGTLDLDPIPAMDDADPYNWPLWKKTTNLALVSFHAMMATFTAGAIQSAFFEIHLDLGVSLQRASYLTSLVIAVLGGAPLFWKPLADRYGRRPIFLLSLVCSLVGNIGCAKSPSYATMGLCRAITAFFISPALAIGSGVVAETFFKKQRGRYIGIWTIMVTMGVPVAPFIMGFVAYRVNYRWIYWILAIINGVQFVLYLFFGPETRYIRRTDANGIPTNAPSSAVKREYLSFGRIDPAPLTIWDFLRPLAMAGHVCIMVPAATYSMVFLIAGVLPTIEVPQIFVEKFGLNTQQIGLQNLSFIVGAILGEQIGGFLSDKWMLRRERRDLKRPEPEYRLWLSYIGYLLCVCGVVVFLVQIGRASDKWNITPLVGAAIGYAGVQIVTTVMITYAVDCYREEAASVGVFITFVRQTWGFIGPFWFPPMIQNVGLYGSAGIVTALIVIGSIMPTVLLQWKGRSFRNAK